ncbi:phospholipase A2 group XV-like isoform X1 [Leptopilina heterotoma]|uniref:phospholipase A2 group XV-like isoform X1 n=1 Tax=Leptopilina heterotoma TaxID=63436 RepID=UPI001CA8A35E|nr:phospholipase A2 group XV-like isoform X1 [Leptopilina heterotoma]
MHFKLNSNVMCILFIHFLLTKCIQVEKNMSPVIFIPGDGGSQVEAKLNKPSVVHYICEKTSSDFFNIWLNLELLVPVVIDCWIDNMKLNYDNTTRKTKNQEGVDIRIPGWGDPFSVEYLDPSKAFPGSYFKDIGNMLVNELGYVRNLSLRGAPYDFRKGPNESEEFFVKLKLLIEETYTINSNAPVTLIAHSMGAPMSLIFLQRQTKKWKDKYLSSLITLAGVWGGSVKALKVFAVGDDLGAYVLRESVMRNEQITSPSLGWLLPSTLFWKNSEILVQTDQKNYTLLNLKEFFIDINVPNGWEFRIDNEKYQKYFEAPEVKLHCLHGVKVGTVERLYYKPGTSIDGYPELINGDGDGTVNLRSLNACLLWQKKQIQKIYHKEFVGVNHMDILKHIDVLNYIKSILQQ